MTKTFKELQEVDTMVADLYVKFPTLKETKFGYAYKRFVNKNYAPIVREFNEELVALRVQHAMEDEKTKEILVDRANPRGYKYTKAGLTAVMADEKKLANIWDNKDITIVPFLSPMIPIELNEEQNEMLAGLVL